jgi:LysM repeat protein
MEEQTPQQPALSCPHLGILDDPGSSHSFPSTWNCCFYSKSPTVPSFEQQKTVCLTPEHGSCPVYQAKKGASFPRNLRYKDKGWKRIYAYILVILLLVLAGWAVSVMLNLPAKAMSVFPNLGQGATTIKIAYTATAPVKMTATVQPTAAPTQIAILTLTSTSEITEVVIKTPALETSFKIGDKEFVIHRVKDGEGLDYLSKAYNTTPAVIQATNYLLSTPLWVDSIVIIRPNAASYDPTEPIFQAYQIPDHVITFEKLAQRLGVDLAELKYYNACANECSVTYGAWVLIPRKK